VATTIVAQVYPSATVLPENQLKFYVQFSAPMSRGPPLGPVRTLPNEHGSHDALELEALLEVVLLRHGKTILP